MTSLPSKPATTDAPVLAAIAERWSPVAFSNKPVEESKIKSIFEAARWAPSSYNEQPWRYVYTLKGDGAARETLESLLGQGNAWARQAGMLMISFTRKTFTKNGKENRHHFHDLGAATGYIALELGALGLVGHQMAGFAFDQANNILGVPEEYIPGSMMAIGYPGDPAALPEDLKKRQDSQRSRNPVEAFAFRGTWKA